MKVGFDKKSCLKILSTVDEDQALSLLQAQLSLSPWYGGCGIDCGEKGWCTEITKLEEFQLQPSKSIYIWQYVHCVGEHNILYHQEIATTNSTSDIPPIPNSGTTCLIARPHLQGRKGSGVPQAILQEAKCHVVGILWFGVETQYCSISNTCSIPL